MKLKTLAILPFLFGAPAMADTATVELDTEQQQLSYILGIQVARNMMSEGIDLEMNSFTAGVEDMLAGKQPRLTDETAKKVITTFQQKQTIEMAKAMSAKQKAAKVYLDENAKKDGVVTTESGLQYTILEKGNGASPATTDTVIANYKGTLLDGTVFDSSYDRGEPATFPVNAVIKGWQEVLPMMKVGAKWQVVIPAELAYGANGAGEGSAVGPYETLIFDIELLEITQ